jgi:hypothetical protein
MSKIKEIEERLRLGYPMSSYGNDKGCDIMTEDIKALLDQIKTNKGLPGFLSKRGNRIYVNVKEDAEVTKEWNEYLGKEETIDVFKLSAKDKGKSFTIRPLLNPKDVNKSILSYKIWFNRFKCEWMYKHLCFALVNDKLCTFNFSGELYNKMPHEMFLMDSNKALKVTIDTVDIEDKTLMKNNYEIIEDDKYRFDNTEEKRKYITSILGTGLDLSESLEYCKAEVENVEVNMGSIDGYSVYRTLKEVYADESA